MADTLVNLVTVPIYGRDPKFPKHKINKNSFAQWAIDVKHILKSYRALAREKLLPRDAITPSAKKALWITLPGLENVVQDYPTAAMVNTTTDTGIRQRMAWHETWLDSIITACAPDNTLLVTAEITAIRFGKSHSSTDYGVEDVAAYAAELYDLQERLGDIMRTGVTEKTKLDLVEKAMPYTLRSIIKGSAPVALPGQPALVDTWEQALQRLASEMAKLEQTKVIALAVKQSQKHGAGQGAAPDANPRYQGRDFRNQSRPSTGVHRPRHSNNFKKRRSNWDDRNYHSKEGRSVRPQTNSPTKDVSSTTSKGPAASKDTSQILCFSCNELGHYANKCPKRSDHRNQGSSSQHRSGQGRGGKSQGHGPQAATPIGSKK